MTGEEAYKNRYDGMCRKRIAKCNPEWLLFGFYNSLIITKSYTTAYVYLSYVINFLNTVGNINNITIDDYYAYLASLKNKSSQSQIDAFHSLQKYSKYLKTRGVCEDYMRDVDRPKFIESQKSKDKREKGYLTKEETHVILSNISSKSNNSAMRNFLNARNYAILLLFLNTGIRCAALYKLDVDDVDLVNETIRVVEKGNKYRVINISENTCDVIDKWLSYREELLDYLERNEDALMLSKAGCRMSTVAIYNTIKKIGSQISGKNITPHKLRATYGTQLYELTGDIYFVQQCMGHSSPKTTEMYVRGQNANISQKASDLMEKFLKGE